MKINLSNKYWYIVIEKHQKLFFKASMLESQSELKASLVSKEKG